MIRGLYTSAWSMKAAQRKMDVLTNNIANVNTNAFKKDTLVYRSFPEVLTLSVEKSKNHPVIGTMRLGYDVDEIHTYYLEGSIVKTENSFDMAISGASAAFFTIAANAVDGGDEIFYTRDGAFTINSNGELVTQEGFRVLGEDGPIILRTGDFTVESDGTIVQDGVMVGKLLITQFSNPETLRKFGQNRIQTTDETIEEEFIGEVIQGAIEQSNVNTIREMVDMINVMRLYEANQKAITTQDSTLGKAVNEIGALR